VRLELANNLVAASGGYGIIELPGDNTPRYRQADASSLIANLVFGNGPGGYFDADSLQGYTTTDELNRIPDLGGAATGNLAADPALDADGRLTAVSAALDAGDALVSCAEDIDRDPRPLGPRPDIGADEAIALLRTVFTALVPLAPPRAQGFGAFAGYAILSQGYVDPDPQLSGSKSHRSCSAALWSPPC